MIGDARESRVEEFWRKYLDTLTPDSPTQSESYEAGTFGDTMKLADEISSLIVVGTKTATCSALWEYEAENDPLPKVGGKYIVLDGRGEPKCVIETTEVEVRPYEEVDERFAYEEGEGDRSLEHWREAHWKFFGRTLAGIGREAEMDMPLVCERFRVVYEKGADVTSAKHEPSS